MSRNQELEKVLNDLRNITGVSFCVEAEDEEDAKRAARQIAQLTGAYKEKYNRANFIQNLLLDNVLHVDMYNRAKRLHIDVESYRTVFIIETKHAKDNNVIELLKHLFMSQMGDYITEVDERCIILVKGMAGDDTEEQMHSLAKTIVDMINAEVMSKVRVSYGNPSRKLDDLSRSYKEAKMALEVGRIFYMDQNIVSYDRLGIGRLIYQLPIPLCKMFMHEVFGENLPDTFDEETVTTINKFFDNNLNISETARQLFVHRNTLVYRLEKLQKMTGLDIRVFDDALTFKIATMVVSYMKFMKEDIK